MSARGRGPDSMLVHMTPREVAGLQSLAVANGTSLTINPDTGLPEAFSLKDLLPTLAGAAINYFAPGFGTAIGGALGLSGAAGTGLAVGAATAALSGDLGKGLSAGLGAYGGAGITEGLMGLGTGTLSSEAGKAAVTSEMGALEADRLAQDAIASKLASTSKFDTLSAGASRAMSDPMSAIKTIGGGSTGKGLALAASAIAPMFADQAANTVPTTTSMPSIGKIRPFTYDNYEQRYTRGEPYTAANGGLVSFAAGGPTYFADLIAQARNNPAYSSQDIDAAIARNISAGNVTQQQIDNSFTAAAAPANIAQGILGSQAQGFGASDINKGLGSYNFTPTQIQAGRDYISDSPAQAAVVSPTTNFQSTSTVNPQTGIAGLNQNIQNYAANITPAFVSNMGTAENPFTNINASTGRTFLEERIRADMASTGVNEEDVRNATGKTVAQLVSQGTGANTKTNTTNTTVNPITNSAAETFVLNPNNNFQSASTVNPQTGIAGLYKNISDYSDKITPTFVSNMGTSERPFKLADVEARIRADMASTGVNDQDVFNATGKTVAQLASQGFPSVANKTTDTTKDIGTTSTVLNPSVVTDLTTADTKYIAPGVGGDTGAGQVGGGTTINPNGTITTSPRIPGIPVGGFEGMQQVRDTYEKGGGDLGYTSYAPKTIEEFNKKYTNTGDSKAMYDYLMGVPGATYPTKSKAEGSAGEIMRPYNEATLRTPANPNKRLTWNTTTQKYDRNPDYVRRVVTPILDAAGKPVLDDAGNRKSSTTTYMSTNQARTGLASSGLNKDSGQADLIDWATLNNVEEGTLAEALGLPIQEVMSMFAKVKAAKKIPAKNGGLMQLANGGMAYDVGGSVKADYIDSKGDTHVWDWENGMYRPKTLLKNNKSYTWDKTANEYKIAGAGITGLMDMSGNGPPAGGERSSNPNWDGMTAEQKAAFYDANPTFQNITLAGQKALGILGITNPLESAIARGAASLSGFQGISNVNTGDGTGTGTNTNTGATGMNTGTTGGSPAQAGDIGNPGDPAKTGPDAGDYAGPEGGMESAANGGMIGHYAQGGLGSLGGYSDGGRLLRGPGDGVSDSIPASIGDRQPARLADGEFVVPARIVSELGNGSTEAGARALYKMMARIQANRRKTTGRTRVAVDSKSHKYLPA